jgi:hypothetical protein
LEKLEEVYKFLNNMTYQKLNQEDTKILNRSIKSNEIKMVTKKSLNKYKEKKLSTKKSLGPDEFTAEFYQIFREELTSMLLKTFHKIEREGMQQNSFCKASIILIPKLDKDTTKDQKSYVLPHMWTLDQGQTQGDWTLIT